MKKDSVQYKGKWHTSVDNDIIRNVELSFPARFLWILLKSYASPSSPVPYPGFDTLAHFMSSFRKDRHTKLTERKPMDEDTLRKYRQELVEKGFLVVERIRNGFAEWENNRYILMDGCDPHRENPGLDKSGAGSHRGRCGAGAKEVPISEEVPKNKKNYQEQQYRASGDGAAAADSTPSAAHAGADAPEPPGPRSKAESFIKTFRQWGKAAHIPATIVPSEREDLITFFKENEDFTVDHLAAIMLAAWMMDHERITPGTETHQSYWHCKVKSKRIKTFLQFLPNIQDELEWKGTEKQIEKMFQVAATRFTLQKAA